MKTLAKLSLLFSLFFLIAGFGHLVDFAYAEIPKTLNFQGRLTDGDGQPLDGEYMLGFALYDVLSGGEALWSESHQLVRVLNGLYSCQLGSINTLANLNFNKPYYLAVSVSGQPLSPRQAFSSSAYSLNSERLGGISAESFVYADQTGNVGIGTTGPGAKLHVSGQDALFYSGTSSQTMKVGRNANEHFEFHVRDTSGYLDYEQDSDSNANHSFYIRNNAGGTGENDIRFRTGGATRLTIRDGGNVGIGTASPDQKLSVVGIVRGARDANETEYTEMSHGGAHGYINTVGDGRLDFRHDGSTKMCLTSNGNVGIGTTSPQQKLHVKGKVKAEEFITGDITFTDKASGKALWRMFEDEEGLYLESAATGKTYKFLLQEVEK